MLGLSGLGVFMRIVAVSIWLAIAVLLAAVWPATAAASAPGLPLPGQAASLCYPAARVSSQRCFDASLAALNHARRLEKLPPYRLPVTWAQLTVAEQLFVLTNLDRVDRGLGAIQGLSPALNRLAAIGAENNRDPVATAGIEGWASNWASSPGPLLAQFLWMYDDGPGSGNLDCPTAGSPGCWGHRRNILLSWARWSIPGERPLMGAAVAPSGTIGELSYTTLFANMGPGPVIYTWQQALDSGADGHPVHPCLLLRAWPSATAAAGSRVTVTAFPADPAGRPWLAWWIKTPGGTLTRLTPYRPSLSISVVRLVPGRYVLVARGLTPRELLRHAWSRAVIGSLPITITAPPQL
jgi:hypothetical protein